MDSFTIACTGKSSILESKFFPPIQLDGKYQIGLKNLYTYNAIFNIKEPHNVLYYYEEKKGVIPKQTVNIIVNVIRVHCNIVSGSYLNGHENHAIYDFFPVVPP